MKKLYLLKAFLLSCLLGFVGTSAMAQTTTVTMNFEGETFPGSSDWSVTNFVRYSSLSHDADGSYSASTNGKTTGNVTYTKALTNVSNVTFYISKTSNNTNISSYYKVEGSADNSTWTELGRSVTFKDVTKNKWTETSVDVDNFNGYIRISYTGTTAVRLLDDITITYTPSSTPIVSTPAFTPASGTVFDGTQTVSIVSETDGATIYYTTNGDEPTASSTKYTAPFTISETTTVKAIAVKDGMTDSNVAEATYTKLTALDGLSALVAQIRTDNITSSSAAETYIANLTGAVVAGVNGNNVYLEEGETGLLLYKSGHGLTEGQIVSGQVTVSGFMYSGLPEITSLEDATVADGGTLPLTTVTLAELTANPYKYMSRRIKVVGATVTTATASKNTTIEQDETSVVLRDNSGESLAYAVNDVLDIIGYGSIYNTTVQVSVIRSSDVTIVGGLLTPDFAFSASEAFATLGETFTAPTLTNNSDGAVSYNSSEESIATVASDGTITIVATGTTVITASVAETATYAAATASYILTVTEPGAVVVGYKYVLVTSDSELVAGSDYIIANQDASKALGAKHNNYRYETPVNFSIDKKRIVNIGEAQVLELGGSTGAWTFYDATNAGYLASNTSGSSNYLKTNATVSNNAKASISITDNASAIIKFNAGERTYLRFNEVNTRFSCYQYEDSQKDIYLYRKVAVYEGESVTADLTLTAEEDGAFYGTCYSHEAFIVPTGLEAGIITDAADNGVLTVDYRYTAGTTVPAKTAVLLKGTAAAQTFVSTTSSDTPPAENLLHGEDGIDSEGNMYVGEDYKYYYLAYNKDTGKDLGFYYGAADGAAFAYKAPYAFLAIPKSVSLGVKGFRFSDNATAIEGVTTSHSANAPIFDLSGRRVKSVAKGGIYIQNGKKFIVK